MQKQQDCFPPEANKRKLAKTKSWIASSSAYLLAKQTSREDESWKLDRHALRSSRRRNFAKTTAGFRPPSSLRGVNNNLSADEAGSNPASVSASSAERGSPTS